MTYSLTAFLSIEKLYGYLPSVQLINPYQDNPDEHLYACGPLIFPKPNDVSGKLTFEVLELNRLPLVERRMDRIDKIRRLWA